MKNKSLVFVLILFILLIYGFGYWYFYNSNLSKISIPENNQVSALSEDNQVPDLSKDNQAPALSENNQVSDYINYKNTQYGFDFLLPLSWQGYSSISKKWEGHILEASSTNDQIINANDPAVNANDQQVNPNNQIINGPEIIIRHPLWTLENPRQDIPVMIFTYAQWDLIQQENLSLGAAPIGPSELGRNDNYIFALPARYNYAFPVGFEEVDKIIETKPLKGFN